jgi:pimeloyl-ACP methyl ester carboxylesterase
MLFFGQQGYRVIAHDRRGHGRSAQPWDGNHMDRYADDLAELIDHLDLRDMVLIGHSTGGGEVSHYIGRHGNDRVAKVVLVGAVPPLMLKTDDNPNGTPMAVFDDIRTGTALNRSQFFRDLAIPFYGFNREGVEDNAGFRISVGKGLTGCKTCGSLSSAGFEYHLGLPFRAKSAVRPVDPLSAMMMSSTQLGTTLRTFPMKGASLMAGMITEICVLSLILELLMSPSKFWVALPC